MPYTLRTGGEHTTVRGDDPLRGLLAFALANAVICRRARGFLFLLDVVEDLHLFDAIRCHGNKADDKMTLY